MQKVLLIGRFNEITKEIDDNLSQYCRVQLCSYNYEVAKGMVDLLQPNLVMLTMSSENSVNEKLLSLVRRTCKAPVTMVAFGSHESIEELKSHSAWIAEKVQFLERPMTLDNIVKKIRNALRTGHIEDGYSEISVNDNYSPKPDKNKKRTPEKNERADKKTILIVDDSPILLRTMESMLQKKYRVIFAISGNKAVESALKHSPDVILLDYNMPGMDGVKTLETLRSMDKTRDIPVIFLTGVSKRDDVEKVVALRPEGYLLKPPSQDRIIAEVEKVLEESKQKRNTEKKN